MSLDPFDIKTVILAEHPQDMVLIHCQGISAGF
jgi:hypothetical protein